MDKATADLIEKLVDDMTSAVKRERDEAKEALLKPNDERLRAKYREALRSINRLSERDAGQLLRSAAHPQRW